MYIRVCTLYTCVCVCMYVCMYVCIYIYIYIHILLCLERTCHVHAWLPETVGESHDVALRSKSKWPTSRGMRSTPTTDGIGTPDPKPRKLVNWCF